MNNEVTKSWLNWTGHNEPAAVKDGQGKMWILAPHPQPGQWTAWRTDGKYEQKFGACDREYAIEIVAGWKLDEETLSYYVVNPFDAEDPGSRHDTLEEAQTAAKSMTDAGIPARIVGGSERLGWEQFDHSSEELRTELEGWARNET